jgi:hypothetical protein
MSDMVLIVALGFLRGIRHTTDADHVVRHHTRQRDGRGAAVTGLLWGVGHTLTVRRRCPHGCAKSAEALQYRRCEVGKVRVYETLAALPSHAPTRPVGGRWRSIRLADSGEARCPSTVRRHCTALHAVARICVTAKLCSIATCTG